MHHTRALAARLTYCDLRFTLTPRDRITLPPDLGSTLRGALGHALRDTACPHACPLPSPGVSWACGHRALCAYADWFEPVARPAESPSWASTADLPRGFVVRPARSIGRVFSPESPVRFTVRLFGRVASDAPRVIGAVARMARVGLGAPDADPAAIDAWAPLRAAALKVPVRAANRPLLERLRVHEPGRAELELTRVDDVTGRCLWSPGAAQVDAAVSLPVLPRDFVANPAGGLDLVLESPLWLRQSGAEAPTFADLRDVALRRIRDIGAYWHGLTAPDDSDLGPELTLEALEIRSKRWFRFSADQGRKVEQRGVTGTLRLSGPGLQAHQWWLAAAAVLHLGKDTVFGLGRLRLAVTRGGEADDRRDLRPPEPSPEPGGLDNPEGLAGDDRPRLAGDPVDLPDDRAGG